MDRSRDTGQSEDGGNADDTGLDNIADTVSIANLME